MNLFTAAITVLLLLMAVLVPPFYMKRLGWKLQSRGVIIGATVYMIGIYLFGAGINGALREFIPFANTTLGYAVTTALVSTVMIVGCYLLQYRFLCGGEVDVQTMLSAGYGAAILELILSVASPAVTGILACYHNHMGSMETWVAGLLGNVEQAQIESVAQYYASLSPLYMIFLGMAPIAIMTCQMLASILLGTSFAKNGNSMRLLAALTIFVFYFLYQFVPVLGFALAILFAAVAILICLSGLGRAVRVSSGI